MSGRDFFKLPPKRPTLLPTASAKTRDQGRGRRKNREAMNARRRAAYTANIEQERTYARSKKKASYAQNPQKYRNLARRDRAEPGAKERAAAVSKL